MLGDRTKECAKLDGVVYEVEDEAFRSVLSLMVWYEVEDEAFMSTTSLYMQDSDIVCERGKGWT